MVNESSTPQEILTALQSIDPEQWITILMLQDMGMPCFITCKLKDVKVTNYAQYDDCIKIDYRQKRKRRDQYIFLKRRPFETYAIVAGEVAAPELWRNENIATTPGATMHRARYRSLDPRWVTSVTDNLPAERIIYLHDSRNLSYERGTLRAAAEAVEN